MFEESVSGDALESGAAGTFEPAVDRRLRPAVGAEGRAARVIERLRAPADVSHFRLDGQMILASRTDRFTQVCREPLVQIFLLEGGVSDLNIV